MSNTIAISEIYGLVSQGEGPMAGRATIFVRVFGCDSRCEQCDSLYAVNPKHPDAKYEHLSVNQIIERITAIDRFVPITFSGGNPTIWDLSKVVDILKRSGRDVWVETQGTYWQDWLAECDVVVVSPKGPFMNDERLGVPQVATLAIYAERTKCHFKVVIGAEDDLDYAELIACTYPEVPMYLSVGCPLVGDGDTTTLGLLERYRHLGAVLMSNPLRWPHLVLTAAFLPQLHVLVHGHVREK
ncbi:hypothetical protein LCGC14_1755290 [marine sediment metagenome]|uniref:Radical SAM core domain-containing protein n=1 Tax=marine sediment metagenome TaxID=412755 RepID=A0A0F9H2R8_9ZZZZ